MTVPPCWFHSLVAHARVGAISGPFLGTEVDLTTLRVDTTLAHAGVALAGGVWRVDHPHSWTWLFATSLDVDAARQANRDRPHRTTGGAALAFGSFGDARTGITVISATGPAGDDSFAARQLEGVHGVLARCAIAELTG